MPPSEAINVYIIFQYMIQPSSMNSSLVIAIGITERERRTICTQIDQPVNVAINSRLLDMQDIKV
jgi:hypothetical protein